MIVRDEARIAKDAKDKALGEKYDINRRRLEDAKRHESYVAGDRSKIVAASQWQNLLLTPVFEARLKKIMPGALFLEFTPSDLEPVVKAGRWPALTPWHHKRLCHLAVGLDGSSYVDQISLYPRECMPEFSVMYNKEIEIPNPDFISTNKVANANSDISYNATISDGVAIIGWREVLVKIRNKGYLTNAQIESAFQNANTPEWQQKFVGTAHDGRPW